MSTPDPVSTDAPLDAAPSVALPVTGDDAFDEAAFIAGLATSADANDDPHLADPATGEPSEAIETKPEEKTEEKVEEKVETQTPAETAALAKARRILASASKKERGVADAVKAAEQALIDQFNTNPTAFFDRVGKPFKQWLRDIGTGPATTEPQEEDRVTALERRLLDADLKAQEAEVNALIKATQDKVRADKDFPRINRSNSHSMVTDLMVEYHLQHGAPLPYRKAAAQVEEYLRTLAAEPAPSSTPAVKASSKDTKPTSRPGQVTLTNDSVRSTPPSSDLGDVDERVREQTILRELGLVN